MVAVRLVWFVKLGFGAWIVELHAPLMVLQPGVASGMTRQNEHADDGAKTAKECGQPAGAWVPSCQSRSPPPPLLSPSSTVSCSDPIAVRGQSTDSGMDWRVVEVTLMLGEAKFISTSWGAETCVWSPSHRLLLLGPKPRRPGVATSPSCEGGEEQLRRRRHGRGERRCAVSPAAAAPPF